MTNIAGHQSSCCCGSCGVLCEASKTRILLASTRWSLLSRTCVVAAMLLTFKRAFYSRVKSGIRTLFPKKAVLWAFIVFVKIRITFVGIVIFTNKMDCFRKQPVFGENKNCLRKVDYILIRSNGFWFSIFSKQNQNTSDWENTHFFQMRCLDIIFDGFFRGRIQDPPIQWSNSKNRAFFRGFSSFSMVSVMTLVWLQMC